MFAQPKTARWQTNLAQIECLGDGSFELGKLSLNRAFQLVGQRRKLPMVFLVTGVDGRPLRTKVGIQLENASNWSAECRSIGANKLTGVSFSGHPRKCSGVLTTWLNVFFSPHSISWLDSLFWWPTKFTFPINWPCSPDMKQKSFLHALLGF